MFWPHIVTLVYTAILTSCICVVDEVLTSRVHLCNSVFSYLADSRFEFQQYWIKGQVNQFFFILCNKKYINFLIIRAIPYSLNFAFEQSMIWVKSEILNDVWWFDWRHWLGTRNWMTSLNRLQFLIASAWIHAKPGKSENNSI